MKASWIVIFLLLASVALNLSLTRLRHRDLPPAQTGKNQALLELVGEGRLILGRYLWHKMDLFHEVLDEQGVRPEQQSEVLPLMRMVSLLDPSFVEAFDQIAYDIWKGHGLTEQALQILDEGLEKNPDSPALYFRKAHIFFMEADYREAVRYGNVAYAKSNDEFEQLNSLRLVLHSAEELEDVELQRRTLGLLLKLRPEDPYFTEKMARPELQHPP